MKDLVSSRGDFKGFTKLFKGDAFDGEEFIPWLKKQLDGKFKTAKSVWCLISKKKKHQIMAFDMQPNLGLWGRYWAVAVVEFENDLPKSVIGRVTRRTKEPPGWADL